MGQLPELLDTFARLKASERRPSAPIPSLLDDYSLARTRDTESNRNSAACFNVLRLLKADRSENTQSDVLAWLLDSNERRFGTHAQGNLGLRLFLAAARIAMPSQELPYVVRREVSSLRSRIDVEVACRGHYLIHIENKLWSNEGADQTHREWLDLCKRARLMDVPDSGVHAVFLSPAGGPCLNTRFSNMSWLELAGVFSQFADEVVAANVRLFASHYAFWLTEIATSAIPTKDDHNG